MTFIWYLFAAAMAVLLIDIAFACIRIKKVSKLFHAEYNKKKKSGLEKFGKGKAFHLVIMGDSTFDVRGDTEVPFGPAQAFVNELAKLYAVQVHLLARAGAKSYDVTAKQLPQLKDLPKVDLIVIYMGANDGVYFKSPFRVGKEYQQLLAFTEVQGILVSAGQIANNWNLDLFPWLQRAWLYFAIHIQNAGIRRAFEGTNHAVLANVSQTHKDIHKNRRQQPYLLDGFHPTDQANLTLGKNVLQQSMELPAIASFFKKGSVE
jgi:lysophospholipase L1-like esterase